MHQLEFHFEVKDFRGFCFPSGYSHVEENGTLRILINAANKIRQETAEKLNCHFLEITVSRRDELWSDSIHLSD